jgi:hypothetical protein
LDQKLKQEELSKSVVHAILSQSGWKLGEWAQDTHCVDCTANKTVTLSSGDLYTLSIDIQLKCTTSPTTDNSEFVSFNLEKDHADLIRRRIGDSRFMLAVMVVPPESENWIQHSLEEGGAHQTVNIRYSVYAKVISDGLEHDLKNNTIRFKKFDDVLDETFFTKLEKATTPDSLEKHYSALAAKFKTVKGTTLHGDSNHE